MYPIPQSGFQPMFPMPASTAPCTGPECVQNVLQAAGTPPSAYPVDPSLQPIFAGNQPAPENAESLQYLNGFLRTQIGRKVRVEFLIGSNTMTDRTGTLVGVGANYILLNESETDDILACDFFNIKFIKFYY